MSGYVINIYVSINLSTCHGGDHSKKSIYVHIILLGINPEGRGPWFCKQNHVQNQNLQEKALQNQALQPEPYSTESGPPWYSLEQILTTIRCCPGLAIKSRPPSLNIRDLEIFQQNRGTAVWQYSWDPWFCRALSCLLKGVQSLIL